MRGPVTAYLNGRRYDDDPRTIPLLAHNTIQIEVGGGGPNARPFDWSATGL
jgi:hypothetical protein